MSLISDRFVITAIVREVDEDGTVVAERQAEPVVCFSPAQIVAWAEAFPEKLKDAKVADEPAA